MKFILNILVVVFLLGGVFWVGDVVLAQDLVPKCTCSTEENACADVDKKTSDECEKYCCGYYQVSDVMGYVIKASNMMFGFIGSLVLLFFIYGGFLFLTAAGSNERVAKGKRVIIGSVIGLLIVFFSYTIVGYIFSQTDHANKNLFHSSTWFE